MRHTDNTFCVFVDTSTHLRAAKIILREKRITNYIFLSTSEKILKKIPPQKAIKIKSIFSTVWKLLFNKDIKRCNILLASRVDSILFQIIFFMKNFEHLYTFDEGLFTIQYNSRYNCEVMQPILFERSFYWMNKFFSFPVNPSYFYRITSKHFTFFEKFNFRHSLIDNSKIELLPLRQNFRKMKNIWIGQPWQSMFLDKDSLEKLRCFIEDSAIDLYLVHPREDRSIISDYLDTSITQIHCISPAEDFLEKLTGLSSFKIFVVASTATISLSSSNSVTLINISGCGEALLESQQALKDALLAKNINFDEVTI